MILEASNKKYFILYINTKNKIKLVFKFYNNDIILCFYDIHIFYF